MSRETQWLLRPARAEEADALSRLCLRSKAHWGHDAEFLRVCAAELTVTQGPLVQVAEGKGRP